MALCSIMRTYWTRQYIPLSGSWMPLRRHLQLPVPQTDQKRTTLIISELNGTYQLETTGVNSDTGAEQTPWPLLCSPPPHLPICRQRQSARGLPPSSSPPPSPAVLANCKERRAGTPQPRWAEWWKQLPCLRCLVGLSCPITVKIICGAVWQSKRKKSLIS